MIVNQDLARKLATGLGGCGCGGTPQIAKRDRPHIGHVAGQPTPFMRGHHKVIRNIDSPTKICCGCMEDLPLEAFYRSARNGVQARCKECVNTEQKAKRDAAREARGPQPHHARKPDPIKFCKHCGTKMRRKRQSNGVLEQIATFERRQFCGGGCLTAWRLDNATNKATMSYRARKHLKESCECCGDAGPLEAHHKDRNRQNNDASNIETLCRPCHQAHHAELRKARKAVAA